MEEESEKNSVPETRSPVEEEHNDETEKIQNNDAHVEQAEEEKVEEMKPQENGEEAAVASGPASPSYDQEQEHVQEQEQVEGQEEEADKSGQPIGWSDLLLKKELMDAIMDCGFETPSEVQQQYIPIVVQGKSVLCQADESSGKTITIVLSILQQLESKESELHAIALCPSDEMSLALIKEFQRFGIYMNDVRFEAVTSDPKRKEEEEQMLAEKCPAVIAGTPSRLLELAKASLLNLEHVKHFVLDECDQTLREEDMRNEIQELFEMTPAHKQVLLFSSPLDQELRQVCENFFMQEETGESDDEEEFTGFDEDDVKKSKKRLASSASEEEKDDEDESSSKKKKKKKHHHHKHRHDKKGDSEDENDQDKDLKERHDEDEDDDEEEEGINKKKQPSYLDQVLKKQELEKKRKNRRRKNADSEELNDMDNVISTMISNMKEAAHDDREANSQSMPSFQKIKLLPEVMKLLKKSDYHSAMIELGMLTAMAEWLAPLPDKSLPSIQIREEFIATLQSFGEINSDYLKTSGIGKAVMFLFKHPKELKPNKQKLEKLIHNWSRPIFNLQANFNMITKEERQQKDMEHVKSLNRLNSSESKNHEDIDEILNAPSRKSHENKNEEPRKMLRPGDPGFIPRARVPMPSAKDYIIRPKSNIENTETEETKKKSGQVSRIEKHQKRLLEMKRSSKTNQAITMTVTK